jgi:hypothetical protein
MDIDLITEAQQLWTQRRRGLLSASDHEKALFALERRYGVDVSPCPRCEARHARPEGQGGPLCHSCQEFADGIDRAWEHYKDHREQIGGQLG